MVSYDQYPDLLIDLFEYFSNLNKDDSKCVMNFCSRYEVQLPDAMIEWKVSPFEINRICNVFCNLGSMIHIRNDGYGLNDSYFVNIKNKDDWNKNKPKNRHRFNSIFYGNTYIYDFYKDKVLPLVITSEEKDESIGTCFKLLSGIITAKHCLTDAKTVSIMGYDADRLNNSPIYISDNENLDVAYIELNERIDEIALENPKILDEVLVLGYPRVSGFVNFLTAEKATISSIADKMIATTAGSIAAVALHIWTRLEMMLITAKIRGGNSGGPIINKEGFVVGVACQEPYGEGYDNLGYGLGIPIALVQNIAFQKNKLKGIRFVDFNKRDF